MLRVSREASRPTAIHSTIFKLPAESFSASASVEDQISGSFTAGAQCDRTGGMPNAFEIRARRKAVLRNGNCHCHGIWTCVGTVSSVLESVRGIAQGSLPDSFSLFRETDSILKKKQPVNVLTAVPFVGLFRGQPPT